MIRLGRILRWGADQLHNAQIEGHDGELQNDTYLMNHAGVASKPTTGYVYLVYFDSDASRPHMIPHGDPTKIPRPKQGETIIYDPDTGENLLSISQEGINIVSDDITINGDVVINGSLTLNRSSGGGNGPVSIDGDQDTDGDSTISPV